MLFLQTSSNEIVAVESVAALSSQDCEKLAWLCGAELVESKEILGCFLSSRKEMVSPWSTNAVEIAKNMGIEGILRMEKFTPSTQHATYDPLTQEKFYTLDENIFLSQRKRERVVQVGNISEYNSLEGLALSEEEISYLEGVSKEIGRPLTDSEVFGFSQINSEHCRHKIFNGIFEIDGQRKEKSLFSWIRETSKAYGDNLVSAYADNVAFVQGDPIRFLAPATPNMPSLYKETSIQSVLSLKAETHNFPTTVEPFSGAATGSGGEIRDRMAGGLGSIPLAGTAVYMTAYPRYEKKTEHVAHTEARPWLYQNPKDILIKASNGASDFGNKFGQPLIVGSLLTFEYMHEQEMMGFDKVIMQAGGVGLTEEKQALKQVPSAGDVLVILGGDNYRIGMGGSTVSSVNTGEYSDSLELNAVQRSNPEMQKRVFNTVRALVEHIDNPIVSIHDHGAGGHLNCLSELVEDTGGYINMDALPVGDPSLSAKELIGNESQERMGLVIPEKHLPLLAEIAARETTPWYNIGKVTGDRHFKVHSEKWNETPVDISLDHLFGNVPKVVLQDTTPEAKTWKEPQLIGDVKKIFEDVLRLESVACKDWLTNKVDRCVSGRIAQQQTIGELQLPLSNVGVVAQDYTSYFGIATAIGHAPLPTLISAEKGVRVALAKCLTNTVFAPLTQGMKGISLSANWMWPAKNPGENARLYEAVESLSKAAIALGINIPTGKDSLSMTQQYDEQQVKAPGTVVLSSVASVSDIRNVVVPLVQEKNNAIVYLSFSDNSFALGGTAYAQVSGAMGNTCADMCSAKDFIAKFAMIQKGIQEGAIVSGHDISSGGLLTTLAEMCLAQTKLGLEIDFKNIEHNKKDIEYLFSEQPGVVLEIANLEVWQAIQKEYGYHSTLLGSVVENTVLAIQGESAVYQWTLDEIRSVWFETSYLLDKEQSGETCALQRKEQLGKQQLRFRFPSQFDGTLRPLPSESNRPVAVVLREKGSNSEREMANALFRTGFDVRDVHMTDLVEGRETLQDANILVAVGGFSNSDVLGSAKGWAGSFRYNTRAKEALHEFRERKDTLLLGVCNGCQLFMELGLVDPKLEKHPVMHHNISGKFESGFYSVSIGESPAVMLQSLQNTQLGIWVAHGEGRFQLEKESTLQIAGQYAYDAFPGNPNGSSFGAMAVTSNDGRVLCMMPHLERSFYPWNWPLYPGKKTAHEYSPWVRAFEDAREWIESKNQ